MRTITLATALTTLSLLASVGHSAPPPKAAMNVDTGLWEVTTHPQMSGDAPLIPDSVMQRLSPEQQAKMKERMQAMMAKRDQTKKFKECMTAEKLSKGFSDREDNEECKVTVITNSASEYLGQRQCKDERGNRTDSKVRFKILSRHQTEGVVDIAVTHPDGKVMNIHTTLETRWLGSDCGSVKNVEVEK